MVLRNYVNRATLITAALAVLAGMLTVPADAATTGLPAPSSPSVSLGVPVRVTPVVPKKIAERDGTKTPFRATELSWPQPGTSVVPLRAGVESRAGAAPVWVEPASSGALSSAAVTVLPRSSATALGVPGIVLQVAGSGGHTSLVTAPAQVRVGVDYRAFAQEYGGNFGFRLTMAALPACALSTPQVAACRAGQPLRSVNDAASESVSAQVPLGSVIALLSSPGSEGGAAGSYAATSLKPAQSWSEGGDSGSFDYTYPITLPGASSQLTPPVDLSYSSQGVDGQTATTQAQSSWAGDGWGTTDSFVEQTFTPCADSPEGVTLPSAQATYDECYGGPVLTLSLDGTSTSLVCDAAEAACTEQADHGATVQHVVKSGNGSGTYNTDYWVVTERNGTAYYFGRNQLPGYASGDRVTNSVDSMPVYSRAKPSADPCGTATGQVCTMAYRWHLDYVTNLTGQAMAYYYAQDTNYYGENNGTSGVPYTRDSHLSEIDYGFPAEDAYGRSAPVPDKVVFTPHPNGRCVATSCDPLTPSLGATKAGSEYPDVPYDLMCAQGVSCSQHAPSFFSTSRLKSIVTEQYSSSGYQNVDEYDLTQTEPQTGDTTNSTLWLASIAHTGADTSAGGSGATPPPLVTTFTGIDLPNRVDASTAYPAMFRYRLQQIKSELGATTTVTYENPSQCTVAWVTAQTAATAASNTKSCYPVNWAPSGTTIMDWFESYAVKQVLVADSTGGASQQETDYSYGPAAWHYDDNEVVKSQDRTYGQFRGYATVTTYTGQPANDPQTKQVDTYYRGMDGDYLSGSSTRSVTLKDSAGGTHLDSGPLAGDLLESQQYLGNGGPVAKDTITSYWVSGPAQSRSRTPLPDLTAQATGVAESWTSTATSDGGQAGATVTETDTTYDAGTGDANFGLATYSYTHTDPVNAAYDSCTATQYAPASKTLNLVGLVSYTETDSVACPGYTPSSVSTSMPSAFNTLSGPSAAAVAAPVHVESATQTFYDDPSFSTTFPQASAPVLGQVTMVRKASGYSSGAFTWQTQQRSAYDRYGRVTAAWDADGNETTTAYAVNNAGLTTGETVTQPPTAGVAHVTSKTLDPTRNLTRTATDANGVVTTEQYDVLGRLTAVWEYSRPTSQTANLSYTYTVSNSGDSGVTTQTLDDAGGQVTSVAIDDSLGRPRQTQTPTPQGGRLISDTFYDSRGWVYKKNTDYWDSTTTPAVGLVGVPDNKAGNQDDYVLDGLGRAVQDQSKDDANLVSTTTTVYNGDATTVLPPGKGTVKTTVTDPLGRTSKVIEYTANPTVVTPANSFTGSFYLNGGTSSVTTYGYDTHGNRDATTDAAGNKWSQTYNLLGQQTAITEADAGTTTMSFDPNGNLLQAQDATGAYLSFTYDALGRKTGEYAAASSAQASYAAGSPGNQLASWVYDNANGATDAGGHAITDPAGQVTTETSYSGGYPYIEQSLGFNVFGESKGTSVTIPSAAQGSTLGTTWTVNQYYTPATGLASETSYPQGGGLPAENVSYGYTTALDLLNKVTSDQAGYAQAATYTDLSQAGVVKAGGTPGTALINDSYDPHTGQLKDQLVTRSTTTPASVDDTSYHYDLSGLLTSQTEARLGSTSAAETQCYAYTTQDQVAAAWTATDNCAATPTATAHATVGDPLSAAGAYWESFGYDGAGDRKSESQYTPAAGGVSTTTYGYNGNASASVSQPTTLTAVSTTGAVPASASYAYYANGEQKTRGTSAGTQTLNWNNAGQLTSVATGATTNASYVYDADGNLLLQSDPAAGTKTLYLPGEQITDNGAASPATGVRFYPLPGGATAVRTGLSNSYHFEIAADQHGTGTLYLDYTAQVPAWRQFDPFGNPRGATATWIDNRGFLGKVTDPASSLTDVGARWYDPATGAFVSVDPLLEAGDPTQLSGYDYAGNDPVSGSDPSGKMCEGDNGGGCEGWTPDPPSTGGGGGSGPPATGGGGGSGGSGGSGTDELSITYDPIGDGLVYDDPTDPEFWEFAMRYAEAGAHLDNRPDLTPLENELRKWGWVCENSDICGGGAGSFESQLYDLAEAASHARMTGQPEPPGLETTKFFLNRPDPVSPDGPTGFVMDPGMDFGKPTGPFKIILEEAAENNAEQKKALTSGAADLNQSVSEYDNLLNEGAKANEEGHTGQVVSPVPWGGPLNGATQSAAGGVIESVGLVCAICAKVLQQPVANFIKSVGVRVFGMDGAGDGNGMGDAAGSQEPDE